MHKNGNTNRTAQRILELTKLFLLIFVGYCLISKYLFHKAHTNEDHDFWRYEYDYDAFFLGSSHMVMGISPMQLWREYGLRTYNLSNQGQMIPTDYWILRNALDHANAKVVVIDVYGVTLDEKYRGGEKAAFDYIPFSLNKVNAVKDLFPKEEWASFLIHPISTYHNIWEEADTKDYWQPGKRNNRGYEYVITAGINMHGEISRTDWDDNNVDETKTTGKVYLQKIIDLCEERGIDVLLVVLPYQASENEQALINDVRGLAEENENTNYLNMNEGVYYDLVDDSTDFYDAGHLNASGAAKVTTAIGDFLLKSYPELYKENDETDKIWEADYIDYLENKWAIVLRCQNDLNNYLMLLSTEDCITEITVYNEELVFGKTNSQYWRNLGYIIESGEIISERMNIEMKHTDELAELPERVIAEIEVKSALTGTILDQSSWICCDGIVCRTE